ncbi:MAG TPA: prolipoprotein diacylglyceryl transferase family protein [Anaerolineales bacterium]|nr:prolipoprotein diacylglyceryl transferase family protein [Anaerolineales bacterium]
MLPTLQVGPLAVQVPGLVLLIGLWLGLSLAERRAGWYQTAPANLYNLVLVGLIAGVSGARLVYVARYPAAFAASPLSLISLNPGLLDSTGGVAVALLAAMVFRQRKQMPGWPTLDALTHLMAVLAIALEVAHLASGEAFGSPTGLPWGIELWGARRHPSQIYAILAASLILGWLSLPQTQRKAGRPGVTFLAFVCFSAGARLFLEAFRGDSLLLVGGLRAAQLVSWLALALGLIGLARLQRIGEKTVHRVQS